MLADVNLQGYLRRLRGQLDRMGLWEVMNGRGLRFASFSELGIAADADDRRIWNMCQSEGWVLFTDNRNNDGPDSLQATLDDSWMPGHLPVLTLSRKIALENNSAYAQRVAISIADLLFGIVDGENLDRPRIYVPQ